MLLGTTWVPCAKTNRLQEIIELGRYLAKFASSDWPIHTNRIYIYIYQIISVQKRSMHNQYNVYIHLFNDQL